MKIINEKNLNYLGSCSIDFKDINIDECSKKVRDLKINNDDTVASKR